MNRYLRNIMSILVTIVSVSITLPAWSGEGALYDPVAPKEAAFIRVFNASSSTLSELNIDGKAFPEIAAFSAGEYLYFINYKQEINLNGQNFPLTIEAKKRYTLIIKDLKSQPLLLNDPSLTKRTKSMIIAYNLISNNEVDLKAAQGKAKVITGVSYLTNSSIEINAVKTDFGFFNNDNELSGTGDKVSLERGKVFSAFLTGTVGSEHIVWTENKDNTRI